MKNTLKWLEIIELRTGTNNTERLEGILQSLVEAFREGNDQGKIKIYKSHAIHSDYCIHLIHKSTEPDTNGSPLGLNLVASLKQFGLLNHQIWHEMKIKL